jgi:methyl-accepting chemotaxis protein
MSATNNQLANHSADSAASLAQIAGAIRQAVGQFRCA